MSTIGDQTFTGATIDGENVTEITADDDVVWTADTTVTYNGWLLDDWADAEFTTNRTAFDGIGFEGSPPSNSAYTVETRPTWTDERNTVTAQDGYLDMTTGNVSVVSKSFHDDINMNWFWEFEMGGNGSQVDDDFNFILFGDQLDYDGGWWLTPRYGYWLFVNGQGTIALLEADGNGNQNAVFSSVDIPIGSKVTARVRRQSGGVWDMWVNGEHIGQETNTRWGRSEANKTGFTKSSGTGGKVYNCRIW